MAAPKILVIPGSLRAKSYNVRLAALATKELTLADAEVTRISLFDYPLPIYDADTAETAGPPSNAVKLKQLMSAHQGVFIASPEYNASITPLIKNTIDWIRPCASAARRRSPPTRIGCLRWVAPRPGVLARRIHCWRCAKCWRSAAARW
jgi:NAD(P)H-dependent FMN reductase